MRSRIEPWLPTLLIVAVWWVSLSYSFQFDDWNVIVNEPRVHSLGAWWESMPGIRPLLKLSYAVNYVVDAGPIGFRVFNVMVHALNATLVFVLLRGRGSASAALIAALVFALHPVQTEAVTYVSGRSTSLSAFFCLVSLWCWDKEALNRRAAQREERKSRGGSGGWGGLAGCAVAYVAAVACKETAVVLPLALWLWSADRPVRETLTRLLPLFAIALALLALAWSIPTYRHLLAVSLETRSIGENLLTQSRALIYLAGQLVRPWNGNADPQLPIVTEVGTLTALLCAMWAGALIASLYYIRRAPVGAFAVLWFLVWLAPTNSLLPRLDPANDRQLYLALIGPAWWLAMRVTSLPWRTASIAAPIVLLAVLGVATIERNQIYRTEVTFWEATAASNPMNARAANNLGMAYAVECRRDAALNEFSRAIALDGADYKARINRRLLQRHNLPGVDCP